ncbi:hypothetical protein G9F71_019685 [Clostridium sp. FP2]|uniref:hypothetical protein n=1 Tax=Clostridium TaxID=1485 RepID=UPI0013E90D01|nr:MULTISPECIES: hypothetical protein [Clostridium]MBW9156700.1 hypothetical protein [Clostridium tagluense]MBZ9625067.1 hypothetical protein [Clostridium sp. FP2]WLC64862.1 hypothetical protein KTC93_18765 [Clostridium tagluense]
MRDNLDEIRDIFNIELKDIKVSEELKLKTLEKLDKNSRRSTNKAFIPMTLTMVACLFMGFIIYPIYNKNNLMKNEEITMNTRNQEIKILKEPYEDTVMIKDKTKITEDKDKITEDKPSKIVEENKKLVNKNSNQKKQEKQTIILNEKPVIPFKIESSVSEDKKEKDTIVATNEVIDSEKLIIEDNKDKSVVLQKKSDFKFNEETKMRTLSLQQAKNIFGESIKTPVYIPKDFVMEKILIPEKYDDSCELYEIIYSNNSQYFKITEYKNIKNSGPESKVAEESIMIMNVNKISVKYILQPSIDNKELPYVKLFWEKDGKKYSVDGNTPWAELINIAYYIVF